ncbi:hypothetical protein predicted by Glimmer/Critica [Salmonella enterica subsp. enterica serovar Weltevreden str. 2007-60-3289-1]|nr:hypothetical protein predicted by Glimmer/Critica [Salmonella enterica subsp. enterica serovar Weltevreden str. 2007-60-3289-1]
MVVIQRIVGEYLLRNRLKFRMTPENVMHHDIYR